jgi:hypothetical protein
MVMSGNASVDLGEYLNIRSFTEMKLFIYDIWCLLHIMRDVV